MADLHDWKVLESKEIAARDIEALLAGRIAAICIPNFLERAWCAEISRRFLSLESPPIRMVDYGKVKARRLGLLLCSMLEIPQVVLEQEYFGASPALKPILNGLYQDGEDPLPKLQSALRAAMGWNTIEIEEGGRPYLPYLVSAFPQKVSVELHCDPGIDWFEKNTLKLPAGAKSLKIFRYPKLLNWNLYFSVTESGGTLRMYDRRGGPQERVRIDNEDRYDPAKVAGVRFADYQPRVGDFVIINPDFYHEVTQIEGEGQRISIHSQIGINEQAKEIVFWN